MIYSDGVGDNIDARKIIEESRACTVASLCAALWVITEEKMKNRDAYRARGEHAKRDNRSFVVMDIA
jgi:hypothetical protein